MHYLYKMGLIGHLSTSDLLNLSESGQMCYYPSLNPASRSMSTLNRNSAGPAVVPRRGRGCSGVGGRGRRWRQSSLL